MNTSFKAKPWSQAFDGLYLPILFAFFIIIGIDFFVEYTVGAWSFLAIKDLVSMACIALLIILVKLKHLDASQSFAVTVYVTLL
jgi:hypothetical protein